MCRMAPDPRGSPSLSLHSPSSDVCVHSTTTCLFYSASEPLHIYFVSYLWELLSFNVISPHEAWKRAGPQLFHCLVIKRRMKAKSPASRAVLFGRLHEHIRHFIPTCGIEVAFVPWLTDGCRSALGFPRWSRIVLEARSLSKVILSPTAACDPGC